MIFRNSSHRAKGGFTLLEVVVMVALIATTATALFLSMMTSFSSNRDSAEREAAMRAARLKLEHLSQIPFVPLIPAYGENASPATAREFEVPLEYSSKNQPIFLQGWANRPAGEVLVIHREDADSATLGRDLDGDGVGDGVRFTGFPMDLNGDGDSADGLLTPQAVSRLVIGVVVRWVGMNGREERYELWTVKSLY